MPRVGRRFWQTLILAVTLVGGCEALIRFVALPYGIRKVRRLSCQSNRLSLLREGYRDAASCPRYYRCPDGGVYRFQNAPGRRSIACSKSGHALVTEETLRKAEANR